jgi:glycosyltransferase involved in cell wall biosynthesis
MVEPYKNDKTRSICFITTIDATMESFLMELASFLNSQGVKVFFICHDLTGFSSRLPAYIHFINVNFKRGVSFDGVFRMFELYRIFKKHKFDLVQYSTPNAALFSSIACYIAGISNRLYAQWGLYYASKTGFERFFFKNVERITCAFSTHIQPISVSNREFAIKDKLFDANKSSVIGTGSVKGVNLEIFNYALRNEKRSFTRRKCGVPEDSFVFGFVGRLNREKGINELLAAFNKLSQSSKKIFLLICGEFENSSDIDQSLLSISLKDEHIIFCGHVKNVENYMSAMDVLVFPTYREGFGEVSIEAQAMGTTVISTNVPGPADSVKNRSTGLLINPKDTESLFEAMSELLNNTEMRNLYSENAVRWVSRNFESSRMIEEIGKFRLNLMRGRYEN